jgi:hypothetical protein
MASIDTDELKTVAKRIDIHLNPDKEDKKSVSPEAMGLATIAIIELDRFRKERNDKWMAEYTAAQEAKKLAEEAAAGGTT